MRVLVVDKVSDKAREIFENAGFAVDVLPSQSDDELSSIIENYDAMVLRNTTHVTARAIEKAKKIKIIGRAGVGVDNIDVDAASKNGIWVVNSPDGNTVATSEHTFAMILALSRKIPQAYSSTKDGNWDRSRFMGNEICGKTIGVIGFGKIGSRVAGLCSAFGMKVLVYDPFAKRENVEKFGYKFFEDLNSMLEKTDYVTLHVPKTKETLGIINKNNIPLMKDGVKIINCARGGLAVEADLAEGIKSGKIGGIALDVYETEPDVTKSPLFGLDGNIIFVPHLGASTKEAQTKVAVDVSEQITEVLKGGQPKTPVNKI